MFLMLLGSFTKPLIHELHHLVSLHQNSFKGNCLNGLGGIALLAEL